MDVVAFVGDRPLMAAGCCAAGWRGDRQEWLVVEEAIRIRERRYLSCKLQAVGGEGCLARLPESPIVDWTIRRPAES